MYAVSEDFLNAIKNPNRKSTIYGTLTTTAGVEYPLNDSTFIRDSFYITNQIVNDSKLCFGAVYAGECGFIINSPIDRYTLFGAKIELYYLLEIASDNNERVRLGVFFVDTPERIGSKIKITAIDCMSNFDMPIDEDTNGSWYELVAYIAQKCGVELAQTKEEIEALHINATNQTYTIMQEHISTYRDALALLSMVICANATIDRNGKLKFVQFAVDPCDSNDRATRLNNCKFSDYITRYAGITARFFKDKNYAPYSAIDENINGLVFDCGDIPIVGGTIEGKHDTIASMLDTLKEITYVPATLYISSNPAYDLGDKIECKDINNTNDSVNVYIMSYKFEYRKKESIECYGENPLLQNIKDQQQKLAASLENAINAKDMVLVNYTNASDYYIQQTYKEIIMLSYTFQQDCRPIIICTIPFSIDVDGYVEFKLYNGLLALEDATYKGYYSKGEHFATFMYLDDCKAGARQRIRVLAKCYADLTSEARTQEARIKTLENGWKLIQSGTEDLELEDVRVDTTEPTVTIKLGKIHAIAYTNAGKGGILAWDGVLEFIDEFTVIPVSIPDIKAFTEAIENSMQTPTPAGVEDIFSNIFISGVRFDAVNRTWGYCEARYTWGEAERFSWGNI